ncbi:MAG: hypothetical protein J6Y02_20305 [Pseudobutyrivibrio sp.]|nr:hypothetical protein [Pseudobutyrivibrio sp.]
MKIFDDKIKQVNDQIDKTTDRIEDIFYRTFDAVSDELEETGKKVKIFAGIAIGLGVVDTILLATLVRLLMK